VDQRVSQLYGMSARHPTSRREIDSRLARRFVLMAATAGLLLIAAALWHWLFVRLSSSRERGAKAAAIS
jgi:hypothetical protein